MHGDKSIIMILLYLEGEAVVTDSAVAGELATAGSVESHSLIMGALDDLFSTGCDGGSTSIGNKKGKHNPMIGFLKTYCNVKLMRAC